MALIVSPWLDVSMMPRQSERRSIVASNAMRPAPRSRSPQTPTSSRKSQRPFRALPRADAASDYTRVLHTSLSLPCRPKLCKGMQRNFFIHIGMLFCLQALHRAQHS